MYEYVDLFLHHKISYDDMRYTLNYRIAVADGISVAWLFEHHIKNRVLIKIFLKKIPKGASIYHVVRFSGIFDPPPPIVVKHGHLANPL